MIAIGISAMTQPTERTSFDGGNGGSGDLSVVMGMLTMVLTVAATTTALAAVLSKTGRYSQLLLLGNEDCNNDNTAKVSAPTANDIVKENDDIPSSIDAVESIDIRNLRFTYSKSDKTVVQDVSFQLTRGKVVALVGNNGAGKSSLASLLADLYQPKSGSIEVVCRDGKRHDFTQLGRTTKTTLIQLIPQTTSLFNMTIMENVRYSNPLASVADVEDALHQAHCDDFVSRLVDGIHSTVGLNGCQLSGGERQRLALARALLADPAVLIMDEPTSSMDTQGASAVSQAVRSAQGNRAMLLITHQPKTLELADTVLVMKDGRIVAEEGPFTMLRSDPSSELCQLMPTVFCKL